MSDGGRGRASIGVEVWKSSQKWSLQRSAVRSIAWLDDGSISIGIASRELFEVFVILLTCLVNSHACWPENPDELRVARERDEGDAEVRQAPNIRWLLRDVPHEPDVHPLLVGARVNTRPTVN